MTEAARMARMLNLHPDRPDTWPMEVIEDLIRIEAEQGRAAMVNAVIKLLERWRGG